MTDKAPEVLADQNSPEAAAARVKAHEDAIQKQILETGAKPEPDAVAMVEAVIPKAEVAPEVPKPPDPLAAENSALKAQLSEILRQQELVNKRFAEQDSAAEADKKKAIDEAIVRERAALELTAEEETAWGSDKVTIAKIARKEAISAVDVLQKQVTQLAATIERMGGVVEQVTTRHAEQAALSWEDKVTQAVPELGTVTDRAALHTTFRQAVVEGGVATMLDKYQAATKSGNVDAAAIVVREVLGRMGIKTVVQKEAARSSKVVPITGTAAAPPRQEVQPITRADYERLRQAWMDRQITNEQWEKVSKAWDAQYLKQAVSRTA